MLTKLTIIFSTIDKLQWGSNKFYEAIRYVDGCFFFSAHLELFRTICDINEWRAFRSCLWVIVVRTGHEIQEGFKSFFYLLERWNQIWDQGNFSSGFGILCDLLSHLKLAAPGKLKLWSFCKFFLVICSILWTTVSVCQF